MFKPFWFIRERGQERERFYSFERQNNKKRNKKTKRDLPPAGSLHICARPKAEAMTFFPVSLIGAGA